MLPVPFPLTAQQPPTIGQIPPPPGNGSSTSESITGRSPSIRIRTPSTDEFFSESGKKVFPRSVQNRSATGATAIDNEYPIGPGDQFLINFWGKIDDAITITVNSESQLFIPRIGILDVRGKTYGEMQKLLAQKISSTLRDVKFTISLNRLREFSVYVLGAVVRPGPVNNARATMRASEIIEEAGGLTPTGSRQFIEIRRGKDSPLRLDLYRFLAMADFEFNPFVSDNDVIFVPNISDFVVISGAVVRPGSFELKETKKFSEVIERMGGLATYADRMAPIRLSRMQKNGERKSFKIQQPAAVKFSKGDLKFDDVYLEPGDELFVPATQLLIPSRSDTVFVTGEVRVPGPKSYLVSTSIEEYIGFAGGLSERANFSKAVVYKADGSTIKVVPRMIVEPGDTIYIPEKTFKFWQDHLYIVTTFISLATSIIVLSSRSK